MAEDQNFQSPKQVPSEKSELNQPGSPGYVYRPKSQRLSEQDEAPTFPQKRVPSPEPTPELETQAPAPEPTQPIAPSEGEASPEFLSPETAEQELPPAEVMDTSPIPGGVEKKSGAVKTILMVLLVVAFIAGVGALAYFVVLPLVFPPSEGEAPITAPTGQPTPTPTAQLAPHQSFLVNPAAATADIALSNLQYLNITTALQEESLPPLADGQLKEIRISDSDGQVAFPRYLEAIVPVTSVLDPASWFENDFTALIYHDALGTWPIYVARFKPDVDSTSVLEYFREIESVLEIGNFYLLPPGSFADFKDGQYQNYKTRYAVGSQPGASFSYGIYGNYLVFTTNFDGLKAALPLLGL